MHISGPFIKNPLNTLNIFVGNRAHLKSQTWNSGFLCKESGAIQAWHQCYQTYFREHSVLLDLHTTVSIFLLCGTFKIPKLKPELSCISYTTTRISCVFHYDISTPSMTGISEWLFIGQIKHHTISTKQLSSGFKNGQAQNTQTLLMLAVQCCVFGWSEKRTLMCIQITKN
jgi:hypothetical protein